MPEEIERVDTSASRERWAAARRAAEERERERQAAREDAQLRGEDFMREAATLRHRYLHGEIDRATAERLHAALERDYPRAELPA